MSKFLEDTVYWDWSGRNSILILNPPRFEKVFLPKMFTGLTLDRFYDRMERCGYFRDMAWRHEGVMLRVRVDAHQSKPTKQNFTDQAETSGAKTQVKEPDTKIEVETLDAKTQLQAFGVKPELKTSDPQIDPKNDLKASDLQIQSKTSGAKTQSRTSGIQKELDPNNQLKTFGTKVQSRRSHPQTQLKALDPKTFTFGGKSRQLVDEAPRPPATRQSRQPYQFQQIHANTAPTKPSQTTTKVPIPSTAANRQPILQIPKMSELQRLRYFACNEAFSIQDKLRELKAESTNHTPPEK